MCARIVNLQFSLISLSLSLSLFSLSSGVGSIHEAIGDNLSILVQWNATFLAAIVVGMFREYRLALLLLSILPFMALAGYGFGKVTSVCVCVYV